MANTSFGKEYKLCSHKLIESVYKQGKNVRVYPFVVYYKEAELPQKTRFQLVFSAPKRQFRLAHERNRIKRLLREAFRMKKLILEEALRANNKQLALFVIYTGKEELPLHKLLSKTEQLFHQLTTELNDLK